MSDLVERLKWRRFPRDTTLAENICALGRTCDEAAARITELEAENARLREALQPFSDMAGPLFMANYHDNDLLYDPNLHYEGDVKPRLRFRDFRRARAALAGQGDGG